MTPSSQKFSTIALAKEIESPENPGALERRVALTPEGVGKLSRAGVKVFVEYGAGDGVGFNDAEYKKNNAVMQPSEQLYRDKELIIKLKGPSLSSIEEMREGCTLFCMAHFHSYPDRAKLLQDRRINVIAMEEISESPKVNTDQDILGRLAMTEALKAFFAKNTIGSLRVRVLGCSKRLHSSIRRCGNRNPRSLQIIQPNLSFEALDTVGEDALYFYDSLDFKDRQGVLIKLQDNGTHIFDLFEFEQRHGEQGIAAYRASRIWFAPHPMFA